MWNIVTDRTLGHAPAMEPDAPAGKPMEQQASSLGNLEVKTGLLLFF